MNKAYRLIWSHALDAWIAVAETTSSQGKRSRPALLALALISLSAPALAYDIDGGQMLTVPGDQNSPWNTNGHLYVGRSGDGRLNIEQGGIVNSQSGTIGADSGSKGHVKVDGSGSRWTAGAQLHIAEQGQANLDITNGGTVTDTWGYVGNLLGSTATVNISGENSVWHHDSSVSVGAAGHGTVIIADKGTLEAELSFIGFNRTGVGTVTVKGAGSRLTNTNSLYVGTQGQGTLNIQDGATASNEESRVGSYTGSVGLVTVTGAGSQWINNAAMHVGLVGQGTLIIKDGGAVNNANYSYIGSDPGGVGEVLLTGPTSTWHTELDLYTSFAGEGTLTIEKGGTASSRAGFIGADPRGTGVVTVTGENSSWTNTNKLWVGDFGNGTLNILDGATVSNSLGYLGNQINSVGKVLVNGAGSSWNNSGSLHVGDYGQGTLNIENGGTVSNTSGYIGGKSGSNSKVTVTGANSRWSNTLSLMVGQAGQGTLHVEDGAQVTSPLSYLAFSAGSEGTANIVGPGSSWTNTYSMSVGLNGKGTLNIVDGGMVRNSLGSLGDSASASGTVTVSGADSLWTNTNTLSLGNEGQGTLTVDAGGTVVSRQTRLAAKANGQGTLNLLGNATSGQGLLSTGQVLKGEGAATLNFDGGILQATQDQGDFISGFDPLTLGAGGLTLDSNGHEVGILADLGGSGSLNKQGAGTLMLGGNNNYSGATLVQAGTLQAQAVNAFSSVSAFTVNAGTSLDLAGYSQTLSSLNNHGLVNLSGSAPGTVLTMTGPYVGHDGALGLSTVLNGDNSATDKLLFSGSNAIASGTTQVHITNAGGLGAQTTQTGIEVIATENGARLAPGSFTLAGNHLDAGAFEYRLIQTEQGAALHSTSTDPGPGPGPDPEPEPEPSPTYRSEAPLLSGMPAQLRQADLAMLGDMRKRMGDEGSYATTSTDNGASRRVWGRILRIDPKIRQEGTVSPRSEGHMTGFQAGLDLYANSYIKTGLYVGQMEGDMHVSGFAGGQHNKDAGLNRLRSRYLALYGTWQDESGLYADAVVQGASYRSTLHTSDEFGSGATTKGKGWLASVEVGKPWALNDQWQIEPQAQIIYRKLDLDDTKLSLATVENKTDEDWTLRLGARLKGSFATRAGQLQPYGQVNFYTSSSSRDVARFIGPAASTDIRTKGGSTFTEVSGGASLQLNPRTSVYGQLGKLWASGGDSRIKSGVQASLGIKVLW